MNIFIPSAAGAISSTPDIFLMASCSASPKPGTILKAPGIPWGPPGGGGGGGAMPPPGGGGGGGGGMVRCLYSGGMVELAGDPRHSSDCCPERHHARPGTWQGANVRHAPRQVLKALIMQRHSGEESGKETNRIGWTACQPIMSVAGDLFCVVRH